VIAAANYCKLNLDFESLARFNFIQSLMFEIDCLTRLLHDHSSIVDLNFAFVFQNPKFPHETFLLHCWALINDFDSFGSLGLLRFYGFDLF
jgi:hypothetical protein